jgi:hypothetical protein
LQALTLISEIVPLSWLSENSVCCGASSSRKLSPRPASTDGGVWPQPEASVPLQVAPSISDTDPESAFATYTVSVAWSTTSHCGLVPTVTVAGVCPHPEDWPALQVAPSITETV